MEFARRGPATDGIYDGHRFPDPPPHGAGDPMLEVRDALLSQLQKDRLRQEIIVAELAKIERAMALRATSGHQATPMPRHGISAADAERAKPWPFSAVEQFMPQHRGPVGWEHYLGMGQEHDVELPNSYGSQESSESESRKPAMEYRGDECLKPCEGKADQKNAAFDEQKLPDSNETVLTNKTSLAVKWELTGITIPVKKPKPTMKWSCAVCQVQATTEQDLQKHCAGKKHQSNIATLESRIKAMVGQKANTEQKKTSSIKWSCSTCQANGTCESDLQEHLKGSTHQQNIAASCKEGSNNNMAKNIVPQGAKSHESNVPQHAKKPPSVWSCSICQAICTCESDLEIHLKGKRHLAKIQALLEECKNMAMSCESLKAKLNPVSVPEHAEKTNCELDLESHLRGERHQLTFQVLCEKINQEKNNPPQIANDQIPPSEWDCAICQAKCNSESQFELHCRSKKHQQKIEVILSEGKSAKASSLETANELPSDGSNSKNESSEVEQQKALNFCEVCNLQCNSDKMLVHHRTGKKHRAKLNAMCQAKCNSESQFEHHCRSKKRQQKIEVILSEGKSAKASSLEIVNELPSDGSNSKNESSEVEQQKALNFCEVCNLRCNSDKMLVHHRTGKKHRAKLNAMCQAKCNSESQFEHHCRSNKHQKIEMILGKGKGAKASGLETANKLPSDGSDSKNESSEVEQKALNFCEVCNLQCNSDKMLVYHLTGKKHRGKLNANK